MTQELPKSDRTPGGYPSYSYIKRTRPTRRWHEALIDDMLAFPFATRADRAARMGYSETTLGMIMNSDMFTAAYKARRQKYSEILDEAIAEKTTKLASSMLDVMQEAVNSKRTQIPFAVLSESTMSVLEKLGFGAKHSPSTVVQVNQNGGSPTISAERLEGARNRLREVENRNETLSNSPSSLPPPQSAALEGECLPPPKPSES